MLGVRLPYLFLDISGTRSVNWPSTVQYVVVRDNDSLNYKELRNQAKDVALFRESGKESSYANPASPAEEQARVHFLSKMYL